MASKCTERVQCSKGFHTVFGSNNSGNGTPPPNEAEVSETATDANWRDNASKSLEDVLQM